jgi:hypothetical protein
MSPAKPLFGYAVPDAQDFDGLIREPGVGAGELNPLTVGTPVPAVKR